MRILPCHKMLQTCHNSESSTCTIAGQANVLPSRAAGGLLFAYLGPQPAPLIPRWEPFVRENAVRDVGWAIVPCKLASDHGELAGPNSHGVAPPLFLALCHRAARALFGRHPLGLAIAARARTGRRRRHCSHMVG